MSLTPTNSDVVSLLTQAEARALTDAIKDCAETLWSLLLEAHERQAWRALGYDRWEDYVRTEFDMGRQYSYRLLDQGRVIREIAQAAGLSPTGDITVRRHPGGLLHITEREARDIKPRLPEVVRQVRQRIEEEAIEQAPERVQEIVSTVIAEERAKVDQRKEDAAALAEARTLAERAGLDMDEDRLAQRGEFFRLCRDIAALPEPDDFLERHGDYITDRHFDIADQAWTWLGFFLSLQKDREA